ncbi:MAG: hydroxymethylbilane synthase [Bryobacteraceae bacterium]
MVVIGSRGSQLALWQAHWVQARLAELGRESRIQIIKTTGDVISSQALRDIGAKGLFTKEIEEALLAGDIDLAVHSLKDLPTELPPGLCIAAVPPREDARDALVGGTFAGLREGARVGTSSLRRSAQLLYARPDLTLQPVRGNVDTRLRKLDEGQFDALVLAAAGLKRLGWDSRIAEILAPELSCPAVGQGALAIETREEGPGFEVARLLEDAGARAAVTAERAALAALGGGCRVPIGAYATLSNGRLHLIGVVISPKGDRIIRESAEGPASQAAEIGQRLGEALAARGAREILEAV